MMSDTSAEKAPPLISLCIRGVNSNRAVKVYGVKGRYEFRYCPERKLAVRDYFSMDTFKREEEDIRKRRDTTYNICTLLGHTDPVVQAKESVETLINSTRSIGLGNITAALVQIVALANSGIEKIAALSGSPISITHDEPQKVEFPPMAEVQIDSSRLKTEDGLHPCPEPVSDGSAIVQSLAPSTLESGSHFNATQLKRMSMSDLKSLTAKRDLEPSPDRETMVLRNLAYQTAATH